MRHEKVVSEEVLQDSGRGRRKDLCKETLTALWGGDLTIREIAAELHVTDTTIYRRAEEWGLPARVDPEGRAERNRQRRAIDRAARKAEKVAKAAADKLLERVLPVEPPESPPLTTEDRIRATGGAYAKLEALRLELGMTSQQIAYRWQQVRRTVVGTVNAKRARGRCSHGPRSARGSPRFGSPGT